MNKYLEKFLKQLKADNKSERTIETYEQNINKFFKHVGWDKLLDLDEEVTEDYKIYARTEDKENNKKAESENSVNLTLRSLKSFYSFLTKRKIISNNPMKEIKDVKVPKRNPVYLTLEESIEFLNIVRTKNNCNKTRNILIFLLLLHTGLRLSELVNLKVNQLNFNDSSFYYLDVIGKGNKERIIPTNYEIKEAYDNYMTERNQNGFDNEILFLNKDGNPISKKQVENLTKYYIGLAELNPKISTHKLRHSFATIFYNYNESADLGVLQALLGHSNISTTQIYAHINKNKLKEVANNNPLLKKRS